MMDTLLLLIITHTLTVILSVALTPADADILLVAFPLILPLIFPLLLTVTTTVTFSLPLIHPIFLSLSPPVPHAMTAVTHQQGLCLSPP